LYNFKDTKHCVTKTWSNGLNCPNLARVSFKEKAAKEREGGFMKEKHVLGLSAHGTKKGAEKCLLETK